MEKNINTKQIFLLCAQFLRYYDNRLVDHGERVAYIASKIAENTPNINIDMSLLSVLGFFHDIGAYKTEEIDRMTQFETNDVQAHSIYGYLFLKYFTPLKKSSEAVLYHHSSHKVIENADTSIKEYAELLHIADRVDIGMMNEMSLDKIYKSACCMDFEPKFLCALETTLKMPSFSLGLEKENLKKWVLNVAATLFIDEEQAFEFLKMMIYTIDFKSQYTVLHSINTEIISVFIGKYLGLSKDELQDIYYAAYVHDIGKVAIDEDILEFPGKLDAEQMAIMRKHVEFTEEIIKEILPKEIVDIAIHHHEKLDGSGYPRGLREDELSVSDRIVAVADIVSALISRRSYKGKYDWSRTLEILNKMVEEHQLDKNIAKIVCDNQELLQKTIDIETKPIVSLYEQIQKEFVDISQHAVL